MQREVWSYPSLNNAKSHCCNLHRGCMLQRRVKSLHCTVQQGVMIEGSQTWQQGVNSDNLRRLLRPLKEQSCKNHIHMKNFSTTTYGIIYEKSPSLNNSLDSPLHYASNSNNSASMKPMMKYSKVLIRGPGGTFLWKKSVTVPFFKPLWDFKQCPA